MVGAPTKVEVLRAEAARRQALIAADPERLAELLAAEFTYVHGGGRTESKQAYIAAMTGGAERVTDLSSQELAVNIYGPTALVTGELLDSREEGGKRRALRFRIAALWVKVDSNLRLVHWQVAKIGEIAL